MATENVLDTLYYDSYFKNDVFNDEVCTLIGDRKNNYSVRDDLYFFFGDGFKRSGHCKRVALISGEGKVVKTFESISGAANYYGINKNSISQMLRGKQKTVNGLVFKYV